MSDHEIIIMNVIKYFANILTSILLGGGKKGKKKKGGQKVSLNAFLGDTPTPPARPTSSSNWADDDDLGPVDCK